ncbi:MAG: hypothetical protein ABDI20_04185 [Candidatus Bipolaricaulaceae bacterium]
MKKLLILMGGGLLLLGTPTLARFRGEWTALVRVVPSVALEKCILTLQYAVDGNWTIGSISKFDETGLIDQSFTLSGRLGPLSFTGGMAFNPTVAEPVVVHYPEACDVPPQTHSLTPPAYKEAWARAELTFAGVELGMKFHLWAYPYHLEDVDSDGQLDYYWPCCPPQTESYALFTFSLTLPPFGLKINLADCCTGIRFRDALLTLTDVPLCCGLTYDAELHFTRAGFSYFETSWEFPLCCGISVEVATRFTVDHKRVRITPKWMGMGQACFILYGNVVMGEGLFEIAGLELYGYRLRCDFTPCSYVELLTAFDVAKLEDRLDENIFEGNEFEYWKIVLCGPGCCGGTYTLSLAAFFQPSGSLFGVTRVHGEASLPLMANFDLLLSLGVSLDGGTRLAVGWSFRF